jgi:hypothetical protein
MMITRTINVDHFDIDALKKLIQYKIITVEEAMQAKVVAGTQSSLRKEILRKDFEFCSTYEINAHREDYSISLDEVQRPFESLLKRAKDDLAVKLTDLLKEVREQKGDFIYDTINLYIENNVHPEHNGAICGMRFRFKGVDIEPPDEDIDRAYILVDKVSERLFEDIKNENVSFGRFLSVFSDDVIEAWKKNNIRFYDGNSTSDRLSWSKLDTSLVVERSDDH